jgi:hypothetical protein
MSYIPMKIKYNRRIVAFIAVMGAFTFLCLYLFWGEKLVHGLLPSGWNAGGGVKPYAMQIADAAQFDRLALPGNGLITGGKAVKFFVDNRIPHAKKIFF